MAYECCGRKVARLPAAPASPARVGGKLRQAECFVLRRGRTGL